MTHRRILKHFVFCCWETRQSHTVKVTPHSYKREKLAVQWRNHIAMSFNLFSILWKYSIHGQQNKWFNEEATRKLHRVGNLPKVMKMSVPWKWKWERETVLKQPDVSHSHGFYPGLHKSALKTFWKKWTNLNLHWV